ncbi:hypothetical protein ASC95_16770 [Pelomonas sp. Root1217]|uniref:hypothetical protein n=1 Tax=Pelomonas sp. Root1217 TaxID=1736430 RepID=UPI0007109BEA|nr:hypothetical protein [Pelomonas sp. Root1217]KQV49268.1 hypothetical protein ASC95_16770 [Pelomonas sp. Root1217]
MNSTTTTTKFSLAHRLGAWVGRRREARFRQALRRQCPPATLAAEQIPPAVRAAWMRQAPDDFPGLAVDDAAWLRCSTGLAQFFEACRLQQAQGPCALPSKAADSVWHVWLQTDAAGLAAWQQRYFGQHVEHREAEALGAPLDECLARAWAGACRSEGRSPIAQRLPFLFALDGLMRLPTGWAYGHERGVLVHRQIDGFGQFSGSSTAHAAVGAAGLAGLGLLSASEAQATQRRRDDSGSGDGGFSWGYSFSDGGSSDCGSSDGGGASCDGGGGSSCGGSGCGGGGGS